MNERIIAIFEQGIRLLGSNSEMPIEDWKILRGMLAEGFYSFCEKNKNRKSKKSDYEWLLSQVNKMGINA